MNFYAFIISLVLALFLFYLGIEWLGLLFLIIAVIVLIYNPAKEAADKTWEEVDKAQGSSPEEAFGKYIGFATKKTSEWVMTKPNTKYNLNDVIPKSSPASKNFFSELKALFK